MTTWVYIQSEVSPDLFTVGFYKPDGTWEPDSDHRDREEAAKRVRYLNGGNEMSDEIRKSMYELADYLYKDEQRDYEDHKEELNKEEDHIFYHVKQVLTYLKVTS